MYKPTSYPLGVLTLYMNYFIDWKVHQALRCISFNWSWGKISFRTQFTFTEDDAPMQFIEFKMWAEYAYANF